MYKRAQQESKLIPELNPFERGENDVSVSVVIPLFNGSSTIARAIESVLAQTYPIFEILVIDDCSSDGGDTIVASNYKANKNVKLYRTEKNSGAAEARNIGIQRAEGDLIAFLDADDYWCEDKTELQVDFLIENDLDGVFSSMYIVKDTVRTGKKRAFHKDSISLVDLLYENVLSTSSVMLRNKKPEMPLMPNLRRRQDYAYWLRLVGKGWIIGYLDIPLVHYDESQRGLSANKLKLLIANYSAFRTVKGISRAKAVFFTMCNIYRRVVPGASKTRF